MRPLHTTVESWGAVVSSMPVTTEMVLSTLKRMRQLDPSKCFIWSNFFLCFLMISEIMMKMISITVFLKRCQQFIAVIILIWSFGLDLMKCSFVITQLLVINWSWLTGEKFCFAWLSHVLCWGNHVLWIFLRPQRLDGFNFFLFFPFSIGKDGKVSFGIGCYETGFIRRQQTNNSLSPVFMINS